MYSLVTRRHYSLSLVDSLCALDHEVCNGLEFGLCHMHFAVIVGYVPHEYNDISLPKLITACNDNAFFGRNSLTCHNTADDILIICSCLHSQLRKLPIAVTKVLPTQGHLDARSRVSTTNNKVLLCNCTITLNNMLATSRA